MQDKLQATLVERIAPSASSTADEHLVAAGGAGSAGEKSDLRSLTLVVIVLVLAAFLRFFLVFTVPLVEPTEARYAQIAEEMATSADFATPRLWIGGVHVPFLGKPPLFFWTAALSIRILGVNEFAVRLPSVIAAVGILCLMYGIVGVYLGRKVALTATIVTATCPLFFGATGTVILDLHLTFFVIGALLSYLAFSLEPDVKTQQRWSLGVFAFLAGGFLTKGPVVLILFGLPVLLWTTVRRKWGLAARNAWSVGMPLFIVVVSPWFIAAELRNPGFLRYFFINENVLRYLRPEYGDLYGTGHRFPFGMAMLMFFAACIPWTPVAAWQVFKARWAATRPADDDDVSLFLFLGFATQVAFWCFARQLLATYLLPATPLFAVWTAHTACRGMESRPRFFRVAALAVTVWVLLLVAASPAASKDSTRGVLAEAAEIARRDHLSRHIIFAERTPYSARFYQPNMIDDHPVEPPAAVVSESIRPGDSRILILRASDIDAVPQAMRERLRPTSTHTDWLMLVPPPATQADDGVKRQSIGTRAQSRGPGHARVTEEQRAD